jgi:hypothetical protein
MLPILKRPYGIVLFTLTCPRHHQSTANNIQDSPLFLLEKRYDALHEPMSNYLNGTCQVGQLLEPGYEQELRNGQFLRDAYVYTTNACVYWVSDTKRMAMFGIMCTIASFCPRIASIGKPISGQYTPISHMVERDHRTGPRATEN